VTWFNDVAVGRNGALISTNCPGAIRVMAVAKNAQWRRYLILFSQFKENMDPHVC
jgi:hypothetical protein